jgi:hypothetical protein
MGLKEHIQDDMKTAMRSGDKGRLATVRLILEKMGKQRRESIVQFEAGARSDLVAKEAAELAIITSYLPAQLSQAELDTLINEAIAQTGAASIKDMGKVMAQIKAKAQGRADMAAVGARIKARLS